MQILFVIIPIGVLFSLGVFFIFEFRALKSNKNSNIQAGSINEKFQQYNTLSNTVGFGVVSYILTLIITTISYDSSYGLIHALLYIFVTTLIGSVIIFLVKIKKSLLIKVFAAFLYGVPHMIAASAAFLTSFVIL